MTIGIYALYWEEQDLMYIGLSENIERRYKDHLRLCSSKKHTNYKVQETYNIYGKPTLWILEECQISELNNKEICWTNEFDTLNSGLNIVEPGIAGGSGINNSNSKYSKIQILKVFRSLIKLPILLTEEIAVNTGVSVGIVRCILQGKNHIWLQEKYPWHFALLERRRGSNISPERKLAKLNTDPSLSKFRLRSIQERTVISPLGEVFIVDNVSAFAREHGIQQSHLSALLNNRLNQTKKWKRAY